MTNHLRVVVFTTLVLAGLTCSCLAGAQTAYNEVFDAEGNLRPIYEKIYPLWKARFSDHVDQYRQQSLKVFQGDNALASMPRLIEQSEYENLKRGTEQRAGALRAFLRDHYSGQHAYAKSGIIPQDIVNRIVARSGEAGYEGLVDPDRIAFFYGPDAIRDEQGIWRVVEDNVGFIGGIGDLKLAQQAMLSSYPELAELEPKSADDFYIKLANLYKQQAKKFGGTAILYSPGYSGDYEDRRISKIFSELGIETVTPDTKKKISVRSDGAYVTWKDESGERKSEKIGYIFLNSEHAWVDPTHPAAFARTLFDEASELLGHGETPPALRKAIEETLAKTDPITHLPDLIKLKVLLKKGGVWTDWPVAFQNRGLINLILGGRVGANYTPGVDFVGDKEFYLYVEDLIRFYLHEEPIIHNIETRRLATADGKLDRDLFNKVFSELKNYVIKKVDGRGGDGVGIGGKMTEAEIAAFGRAVLLNPSMYIEQKFTPPSLLNGLIVDERTITQVFPDQIVVTDTPWGRGLPENGNGKVNISDKGQEVTILVVNSQRSQSQLQMVKTCQGLF